MSVEMTIIFVGGLIFSIMLYAGEVLPWFIAAISGAMSSLFLFSAGFYWIGTSDFPEMGWLFIIWAVFNLVLVAVLVFGSITGVKGRFDVK